MGFCSKEWSDAFRRHFGDLPKDLLVLDLETTGLDPTSLPTEIGYVVVRDCKAVDRGSYLLNWASTPELVETPWLKFTLEKQALQLAEKNIFTVPTYERITRDGVCPRRVMRFVDTLIRANADAGGVIAGHNAARFDYPRLLNAWEITEMAAPELGDRMVDSGALVKSQKLNMLPVGGYTLLAWQEKVLKTFAKGIKWSLKDCLEEYGVIERHKLDVRELHGAGADTYATFLLLEQLRELMVA